MKVLVIDEEIPFPLNTGKRIRTWNLLGRLKDKHDITFLSWGQGNPPSEFDGVRFIGVGRDLPAMSGAGFYAALGLNLFSPRPFSVDRHVTSEFRNTVRQLLQRERFDLVHCEWTPYVEAMRGFSQEYPTILSAHNVEAKIWERYLRTETNPLKREYIRIQHRKFERFERQAALACAHVTAVSHKDASVFRAYGCERVTVVPNGVDEAFFHARETRVRPGSMVFTGSMDWRPNQDGVAYFLNEIFPLVWKSMPEATVSIVGRNPPEWLSAMTRNMPGVRLTGTVDDVRPFIAEAALYIVPLRVGGGSRLKILEALAMRKSVLSTTIGAEGLHLDDGEHLLLRDTPEAFADTAVAALLEPGKFTGIAERGRERVLELYTWDKIAQSLGDVWESAA